MSRHVDHVSSTSTSIVLLHFFFFNATATTEIYTLSLHDALPISGTSKKPSPGRRRALTVSSQSVPTTCSSASSSSTTNVYRSEEHTSELQSPYDLVCRLLLEKKKK